MSIATGRAGFKQVLDSDRPQAGVKPRFTSLSAPPSTGWRRKRSVGHQHKRIKCGFISVENRQAKNQQKEGSKLDTKMVLIDPKAGTLQSQEAWPVG